MIGLIGLWSHALAACCSARWRSVAAAPLAVARRATGALVAAFAVTALWAHLRRPCAGRTISLAGIAESARNFAFLAFMYGDRRAAPTDDGRQRAVKLVYAVRRAA